VGHHHHCGNVALRVERSVIHVVRMTGVRICQAGRLASLLMYIYHLRRAITRVKVLAASISAVLYESVTVALMFLLLLVKTREAGRSGH
jgi:hypothetical protein